MHLAISSAINAKGVCNKKPNSKYTPTCIGVIKFSSTSFLILNKQNGIKITTAVMTPGTYFLKITLCTTCPIPFARNIPATNSAKNFMGSIPINRLLLAAVTQPITTIIHNKINAIINSSVETEKGNFIVKFSTVAISSKS